MEENRIELKSSETTKAYCWTVGNRENPPLLLVPGFTGTHTELMQLAKLLAEKYFVVVTDMPGWGESPRFAKKLTIENYADYLKSLFEQLNISKITYAGHCVGGTIGIELGAKFPETVEKIFLISPPYLDDSFIHKLLLLDVDVALKFPKKLRPLLYLWRNRFTGAIANIFVIRIRGKMKKLKLILHYVLVQGKPSEDSIEEVWTSMVHFPYEKIKDIKAPLHIIHGNEDILISKKQVEKLSEFLPSASVDYVLDCGHMPPVENPEGVAEVILRY